MAHRPTTAQLRQELLAARRPCHAQPELFFEPDHRETDAVRALRERAAVQVCRSCPVQGVCFAYAVAAREEHGIWAGLTDRLDEVA